MKILFRKGLEEEDELEAATTHCDVVLYRSEIGKDEIVIGRYSVLPYYFELQKELSLKNSKLINSYEQHMYVANIENWYQDLKDLTPKTWFTWGHLGDGKYVVKGKTNSRKHEWNKRMFADSREKMLKIVHSLLDDCLIAEQGLCIREYVPLKTYDHGINDLPITNEWRFFFYKEELLSYGYYWSFYEDKPETIDSEGIDLARKVASIIKDKINFVVIDVAQTENGNWILIELNDGQMSGLSCNSPYELYKNLAKLEL